MNLFDFNDYKLYLRERLSLMPKRGHGELQKIAAVLRTHTTRLSHILRDSGVHFTPEQAYDLCRHLGLNEIESDYFLLLVQKERAGTVHLRKKLERQLEVLKKRSHELVHRIVSDRILSAEEKALFYSNWYYSAIRLSTSIESLRTIDQISRKFELSRELVRNVLDFLVQTGLCEESPAQSGIYKMKAAFTHLEANSPLSARHHGNWRIKAMQNHDRLQMNELAYTAPITVSAADQKKIREMSAKFIESVLATVRQSSPEEKLMCLGLDWFEVKS